MPVVPFNSDNDIRASSGLLTVVARPESVAIPGKDALNRHAKGYRLCRNRSVGSRDKHNHVVSPKIPSKVAIHRNRLADDTNRADLINQLTQKIHGRKRGRQTIPIEAIVFNANPWANRVRAWSRHRGGAVVRLGHGQRPLTRWPRRS